VGHPQPALAKISVDIEPGVAFTWRIPLGGSDNDRPTANQYVHVSAFCWPAWASEFLAVRGILGDL
jgi:hypothetical protein